MQPQQPDSNPYDFIVNPGKPQKRSPLNLSMPGGPMMQRIVLVAGGAILLIMLVIVASSLLSGGGNVADMTIVAQDQTELERVATVATGDDEANISQQTTLNFAENSSLAIASAQQALLSFLSSNGAKLSTKTLGLKHSTQADQTLSNAAANSTFDQAFLTVMQGDLNSYAIDMKAAFAHSTNTTEKQLLEKDYQDAQLLITQVQSAEGQVGSGT